MAEANPSLAPFEAPEDKGKKKSVALGLALKWDNDPEVRHRLREGWNLLTHYDAKLKRPTNTFVERSIFNVKHNACVLLHVCRLLSTAQPAYGEVSVLNIENLEDEVKQVFSLHNRPVSEHTIGQQAWTIRHLISVLKGTVRADKDHPTCLKRCPKDLGVVGARLHEAAVIND